jgi:hypothetical protein
MEDPLTHIASGDAVIAALAGKTVMTDWAVFTHPLDVLVAVQVYVVTAPIADFAYTVEALASG